MNKSFAKCFLPPITFQFPRESLISRFFSRYTGFWWCPVRDTSDNSHYILFEQVDESEVAEYKITSYDGKKSTTFLVSRIFSLVC